MRNRLTVPATLYTATPDGRDDMNNVTATETATAIRCWPTPDSTSEDTYRQNIGTDRLLVYFDPAVDLTAATRLTLDGIAYEFVGPPKVWRERRTRLRRVQTATVVRTA